MSRIPPVVNVWNHIPEVWDYYDDDDRLVPYRAVNGGRWALVEYRPNMTNLTPYLDEAPVYIGWLSIVRCRSKQFAKKLMKDRWPGSRHLILRWDRHLECRIDALARYHAKSPFPRWC